MGIRTNMNNILLVTIACFASLSGLLTQSWWMFLFTAFFGGCYALGCGLIRPTPQPVPRQHPYQRRQARAHAPYRP